MVAPRYPALLALLVLAAFAGCMGADKDNGGESANPTSSAMPAAASCSLDAHDVPAHVDTGQVFTVDVKPLCNFAWESDHVAAHFGSDRGSPPALSAYPNACTIHGEKAAGPHMLVNCTIAQSGTYYMRGHAHVMIAGQMTDLWGPEVVVVARPAPVPTVGAPAIRIFDVPSTAQAGHAFAFNVTVDWAVMGAHSSHMGAHTWTSSQTNPVTAGAGSCVHVTDDRTLPARIPTSCTGASAGSLYLRGHAKIENGGSLQDYWSEETVVQIS